MIKILEIVLLPFYCIQNIINEKMYLAMWFWFVFMIIINTIHTFYRVATIFFDKLRFYQIFKTVSVSDLLKNFHDSITFNPD